MGMVSGFLSHELDDVIFWRYIWQIFLCGKKVTVNFWWLEILGDLLAPL